MIDLSIVLITKNQAWNVARLIESVLDQIRELDCEIVQVDSASEDDSVKIGSTYPIGVLRLNEQRRLTPAAGRYIGFERTTGTFVLFMDGDMELCAGWLAKAIPLIKADRSVAAVTGNVLDMPISAKPSEKPVVMASDEFAEIRYGGGAALYKRSVLEEVGQFNPHLCSDEEPDLCIRLRHAGYRIVQTKQPIAYHYTEPRRLMSTMIARWRRNLYLGFGQNLRYHLGRATFWPYLRERGYGLTVGVAIVVGLAALMATIVLTRPLFFVLWLMLLVAFLLIRYIRKGSFTSVLEIVLHRLLILAGTVKGFLMKTADPQDYPAELEVVREIPARSRLASGT